MGDEPTSLRNKQPGTGFSRGQPLQRLGVTNLCLEIGDYMLFATGGESLVRVVPVFALPYAIWTLYFHLFFAALSFFSALLLFFPLLLLFSVSATFFCFLLLVPSCPFFFVLFF